MSPALAAAGPAASRARPAARRGGTRTDAYTLDLVLLTVINGDLAVALTRADAWGSPSTPRPRERLILPWEEGTTDEPLDAAATRLAHEVLGESAAWMEQVGAFADARRHPAPAPISVAFVGLAPAGTALPPDSATEFYPVSGLPAVPPRQRAMIDAAVAHVRSRVTQAPVAFRLLPPSFTLSELQELYELLLGRQLHKASFRRALQGARIVEPTDVWRSEGRGRPAQLFRYAPRRKRTPPRGVRFDV